MTKKDFDILVEKYNKGVCSLEEAELIEKWAELHYKKHSEESSFASESDKIGADVRIWNAIKTNSELTYDDKKWFNYKYVAISIAACLILVFTIFYIIYEERPAEIEQIFAGTETKNVTTTQRRVILPDCSLVILEPGSKIITAADYDKSKRSVYLIGKAFFEVKHKPESPFFVFSGDLVTEVIGTSFWITPKANSKMIEVSVVTGQVSVYTATTKQNKKQNGVIARPNQIVTYNTESKTIIPDLISTPEIINPPPQESSFTFDESPLDEILTLMRNSYSIDILTSNPNLNKCLFTGDLNGLGLYQQLDHICEVIQAEYNVRGTTIIISGNGCTAAQQSQ